jgi:hypothetical protein
MMKGALTISRPRPGTTATISIRDESSYLNFVTVEVDLKDFAEALLGLSEVDCTFELRNVESVGKVRETKDVIIQVTYAYKLSKEEIADLVAPYEVDGWRVHNRSDLTNHHRRSGDGQRVTFIRFVDKA